MKTTHQTILTSLLVSTLAVGMTFAQGPGGRGGPGGGGGRPPHGPPPGGGGGPGGGGPGGEGKRPLPPVMEALDKDQDGSISEDELKEAVESLKGLDKNNDGKLTEDELRPERPPGAPAEDGDDKKKSRRKPHVPPVIKALDANEDGEISKEEIEVAVEALTELDQNKDGKLSKMETRPNRRFKSKRKTD